MEEKIRSILKEAEQASWKKRAREHALRATSAIIGIVIWQTALSIGSSSEPHDAPSEVDVYTTCPGTVSV